MYRYSALFASVVFGLVLMTLTACDYTVPEGGTLDVRLSSTSSDIDLNKAVVTVEHVSIASNYDESEPSRFESWPNMISDDVEVDLTQVEGTTDTLLARDQVLPGDFDGLNVKLAETAKIEYQKNGKSVQTEVTLAKDVHGNVALTFDPLLLDSASKEATLHLQFDLGNSFPKKEGKQSFQFQPSMSVDKLVVNGDKRSVSSRLETDAKGSPPIFTRVRSHMPQLRLSPNPLVPTSALSGK